MLDTGQCWLAMRGRVSRLGRNAKVDSAWDGAGNEHLVAGISGSVGNEVNKISLCFWMTVRPEYESLECRTWGTGRDEAGWYDMKGCKQENKEEMR